MRMERYASTLAAEHGRRHPRRRPVEEVMTAGPGVNFCIADDAVEVTGTLALHFLAGRRVVHPATGAGELLECPYAVRHARDYKRLPPVLKRSALFALK